MGEAGTRGLNLAVALKLGRVSNLPTVWTNVLAGLALAAGAVSLPLFVILALAFSLFYVAGMYLNDAFDREIDARERPERPIPSGTVPAKTVFGIGFLVMAAGWFLLVLVGYGHAGGTGWRAPLAGAALAGAIVLYDTWHKGNPVSPLLMGLCRVLVYVGAALAVSLTLPAAVVAAALVALCYLIGLTYAAKQENLTEIGNLWPLGFLAVPVAYAVGVATEGAMALLAAAAFAGWLAWCLSFLLVRERRDVPRAVVSLIAGICLLDGVFVAGAGHTWLALLCAAAFVMTLALQRRIAGT